MRFLVPTLLALAAVFVMAGSNRVQVSRSIGLVIIGLLTLALIFGLALFGRP